MLVEWIAPDLRRMDEHFSEAMCLPVWQDERPLRGVLGLVDWRLCGRVTELVKSGRIQGCVGESLLMPGRPRLNVEKIFLIGAGCAATQNDAAYQDYLCRAREVLERAIVHECVFELPRPASCTRDGGATPEHDMETFLMVQARYERAMKFTILQEPVRAKAMLGAYDAFRRRAIAVQRREM
jgi:hypothetical protein